MFSSRLKAALRSIFRSGFFTYVNIFGLAICLSAIIAISIYVKSEIDTDSQFIEGEMIHRIVREVHESNSFYKSPSLSAPFREIINSETGIDLSNIMRVYRDDELISYNETSFFETNVIYTDSNFLEVMAFPLKMGNRNTALSYPNSAIISESIAEKYFGPKNPLGQILEVDGKGLLEVTGVISTSNLNSHLNIDFVVNNSSMGYASRVLKDKGLHSMSFYLKIGPNDRQFFDDKLNELAERHLDDEANSSKTLMALQPLSDIYFNDTMISDIARHGDWPFIQTLIAIALVLLLVMSVNFVNLTIAKLSKNIRNTGIRKTLGSSKSAIALDWFLEAYIITLIATILAIIGCYFTLFSLHGYFTITGEIISLKNVILFVSLFPILLAIAITVIPALTFSSIKPLKALSGKVGYLKTNFIQHLLLTFQLGAAFFLIVFTLVIGVQFNFMKNKDVGLDDEQVLIFNSNNKHSWKNRDYIRNSILELSGVKDLAMAYGGIVSSPTGSSSYQFEGRDYQWNTSYAEPNLVQVLGLEILDGNPFNNDLQSQSSEVVLLNSQAASAIGWPQDDIVGKNIVIDESGSTRRILGVVKDYHYESVKNKIEPLIIQPTKSGETFVIKLEGAEYKDLLTKIEGIWESYVPKYPFSYRFLDESFNEMHRADTRGRELILIFAILTIIITGIGTLSLGAYIQQSMVKETAIRKVLGASLAKLLFLLGSSFIKALVISSIITTPLLYSFVSNWLNRYSYRISLSPFFFVIGFIILASIITTLVMVQSWRAANSNPVLSLNEN